MRLIDADALKELFSEVIGRIAIKPEMNGNLEHMIRASAMVIQMIDDAPSIQLGTNLAEVGTDLVSRQAVKDIFTELYGISAIGSVFDKYEWADICETTANELPSIQPERKIGRWIPCSERQPDKGDDYLVTLWDDGRTWVEIALWNETFGGRWQAVLYNDVDYSDISNVIAWMPLPEYYQKKDGDSE